MKITRFEDLECWQEARKLTKMIYDLIKQNGVFRKDLRLCGQIQSAAGSVMANIAEGFVRRSTREFIQFLFIGMSSAAEVQSHLYIALDQGYINLGKFDEVYNQADKAAKMISGLIKYLKGTQKRWEQKTKETKKTKETN